MIQRFLETMLIPAVRVLLRVFFRQIEIINTERVPEDIPVIYTPNHTNSLIDGMLARAFLPRDPRALAKATLWKNPLIAPFVVASNCIPVHRQQDAKEGEHAEKNLSMFEACAQALADNNCIVLFPEGTSHDEPELKPLKTGAARIALDAEKRYGPLSVRIVPVGLNFDAKQKFRSRVLVTIGDPVDPTAGVENPDPDNRDAVSRVTDQIEQGIKSVTLNYPSWEEGNLIRRAADIYISHKHEDSSETTLSVEFPTHKQLADAYPEMKARHPRKVRKVVEAVRAYDRLLKVLSIQHEHLIQDQPGLIKTISSLQKMSLFVVRLPLALLGIFLNAIPFYLMRAIGRLKFPANRASTIKLVAGLFVFPIFWTLEASILGKGLLPPFLWWLLAPVSGVASLLFLERHAQLWEELRTYLKLNTNSEIREELEERLENVDIEVTAFINTAARL